jgi:hypothetical protein
MGPEREKINLSRNIGTDTTGGWPPTEAVPELSRGAEPVTAEEKAGKGLTKDVHSCFSSVNIQTPRWCMNEGIIASIHRDQRERSDLFQNIFEEIDFFQIFQIVKLITHTLVISFFPFTSSSLSRRSKSVSTRY